MSPVGASSRVRFPEDLAFVLSRIAQFASCPTTKHLAAVKHFLRYLKATTAAKLRIKGSEENPTVIGYFGSSFADDWDDGARLGMIAAQRTGTQFCMEDQLFY